MKFFAPIFAVVPLVVFFLLSPVSMAQASPQGDSIPNPAAEAYLLAELQAYGYADLEQNFSPEERVISGEALLEALKTDQVQSKPYVYIANVTIAGDLPVSNLQQIPFNVSFDRMNFEGDVYLDRVQLPSLAIWNSTFMKDVYFDEATTSSSLYIDESTFGGNVYFNSITAGSYITIVNSTFRGEVDFSNAAISDDAVITSNEFDKNLIFSRTAFRENADLRRNTVKESLDFYGAHVSGELLLDESKILGTELREGSLPPVVFWRTTVEGPASFWRVHFEGVADFHESKFNTLYLSEATFNSDVSFSRMTVESFAYFDKAQFTGTANFNYFYAGNTANFAGAIFNADATFSNAIVVRDADFSDVTFNGEANFEYFTAERFMDFIDTTFNQEFFFYYTTVAWPYFVNVDFNGPVDFEGMRTSEDFELTGVSYNYAEEEFKADLLEVNGTVKFIGFSAPAGIDLSHGRFGNLSISTKDNPEIAFINITATDIDGQLTIENVNMQSFLGEGASIAQSTTLDHVNITKELDMSNASIGFLKIDTQLIMSPREPKAFKLRGMTYSDIDLNDEELQEENWRGVLLLIERASYSPQAYQVFSEFLMDKGHPDWAAEVDLLQKRRERDEVLTPLSGAWLWSWFLDIFVGYGHHPALAFIWSGLVLAIGAFVFRRKEDMLPVEQDDAQLEYNPVWYSFALFLPYIDLGIASKWEPNPARKWARNYKYFHMMLGWILAPIALLTFSGIIG